MDVAVVLTVRNGGPSFLRLLQTLSELDPAPSEVSITDAFSADGTWEALQIWAEDQDFPTHISQVAGNISVGRNAAFRPLSSEWVAVTDADMDLPRNWLELLRPTEENVGVTSGPNHGSESDYFQACTNVIPMHGPSQQVVQVFGPNAFKHGFVTEDLAFAAVTRNCMYRRAAFEQAGGFDEGLLTAEDGELNSRILAAGWKIQFRPEAVVQHQHRTSIREFWRQTRNYAVGQAQANAKDPQLRNGKHLLPFFGLCTILILAIVGALLSHWVMGVALLLGPIAALGYGLKAGIVRRRLTLVPGVALIFALWILASAIYYPLGKLGYKSAKHHAG